MRLISAMRSVSPGPRWRPRSRISSCPASIALRAFLPLILPLARSAGLRPTGGEVIVRQTEFVGAADAQHGDGVGRIESLFLRRLPIEIIADTVATPGRCVVVERRPAIGERRRAVRAGRSGGRAIRVGGTVGIGGERQLGHAMRMAAKDAAVQRRLPRRPIAAARVRLGRSDSSGSAARVSISVMRTRCRRNRNGGSSTAFSVYL